jgi:AraC-like DNA-binding protein
MGPRESEALLAAAQGTLGAAAVGLSSGLCGRRRELRLVGPLAASASHPSAGLEGFVRFAHLTSIEGRWWLESEGCWTRLSYQAEAAGPLSTEFLNEYAMCLAAQVVSEAGLPRRSLVGFEFSHPRPQHAERYAEVLGGPSSFAQPQTCVVMESAGLYAPNILADPVSHHTFWEVAERLSAQRRRGNVVEQVRAALARAPTFKGVTLAGVARQMGVTTGALRRRLGRKNTTFRSVQDAVRAARAKALLEMPHCDIASVAAELGYSEVSAFHRAFRRWTGETPRHYAKRSSGGCVQRGQPDVCPISGEGHCSEPDEGFAPATS